ncbi:Signal transduction histidine kinase [Brevibacterium casei CIP 102111]|uniref:histidine kinase n=2 Tax=Brevibacterium casei TaxID=33889 RepID=A0A2H1JIX8_9MICO|nr:Signal transduction histidine kinase [Brevibacterium casei CIP 102111]
MPGRRSAATLLAREPTKVRTAFAYAVSPVRWWGRIAAMRPDPSRRTDERGNLSSRWRPADVLTLILGVVFGGFFTLFAWEVSVPELRAVALAAVALWVAEMMLGATTNDYRRASPGQHAVGTVLLVVSQIIACALAFAPGSTMIPLAVAGLARLVRRSDRSVLVVTLTIVADACALLAAAIAVGAPTELLIIYLLVGAGVGLLTRLRAGRLLAETQERALLEEQLISQRERATTAALAERARIARDLHDVLAHSLGALTLQLDAAAALAQARRWEGLDARIDRARGLAADGLAESRRAVAALREQPRQDLLDGVAELLRAHRDSGADVLTILPNRPQAVLARLSPEGVEALLRAVQEMLTNVRRHAPGQAVTLEMRFADASLDSGAGHGPGPAGAEVPPVPIVRISARNLVGDTSEMREAMSRSSTPAAGTGTGGFGLLGMRERCEALGGGAEGRLVGGRTFVAEAWVPVVPPTDADHSTTSPVTPSRADR